MNACTFGPRFVVITTAILACYLLRDITAREAAGVVLLLLAMFVRVIELVNRNKKEPT